MTPGEVFKASDIYRPGTSIWSGGLVEAVEFYESLTPAQQRASYIAADGEVHFASDWRWLDLADDLSSDDQLKTVVELTADAFLLIDEEVPDDDQR